MKKIKQSVRAFKQKLDPAKEEEDGRARDYRVYSRCLETAYLNDESNNQDKKVTRDEQSILDTLADQLELSYKERKLMNYSIVPLKELDIDDIIKYLVKIGVVFYSKKNYRVFVADEVVRILRRVRGKEIADKYYRRVLKNLKDSQINLVAKKHGIDRKQTSEQKIKEILNEGIGFSNLLLSGIFKEGTMRSEKKTFINTLIEKGLKIEQSIEGRTSEVKVSNLIKYFAEKEKEDSVAISVEGYERLLKDLKTTLPSLSDQLRGEFEFQEKNVLNAKYLLDYNIKPLDVLYFVEDNELKLFCKAQEISTRGDERINVLEAYKDVANLMIENYEYIASRDLTTLRENGIPLKESELGIKFESITKLIFEQLGFSVDETLKQSLNNTKNKIDILLNLGGEELIIIECKSVKEKGYNNYSSVSRQVKAYMELAEKNGYRVVKSFVVAPEFTDEFVKECGLEYELNLSLITAQSLKKIFLAFKESKLRSFPYKLLLRDVLVNEERVIRAVSR